MGWLKSIFGAPMAVGDAMGMLRDGLDKMRYTAEEKADDDAKERERKREFEAKQAQVRLDAQKLAVEWMKATTPQNATRRWMARMVATLWAVTFTTPIAMVVMAVWWTGRGDQLKESAQLIDQMVGSIDTYMMGLMAFYFGAPHVRGAMQTFAEIKTGRRRSDETRVDEDAS